MRYSNKQDISQITQLDSLFFQEEHQIPTELAEERIERNPLTDLVIYEGEDLLGYVSLFPIPKDIYQQLCRGIVEEERIEELVLPYRVGERYVAYLSSVVINKRKAPYLTGKVMFQYLQEHIFRLRKRGVYITDIVAFAVSKGGHSILNRMKFRQILPNIYIHSIKWNASFFIKAKQVLPSILSSLGFIKVRYLGCV